MRHHAKSHKRQFFYIDVPLDENVQVSASRPTPYETKMMSLRPIPGMQYTERPKNKDKDKQPIPLWKYIQKHGAAHFDAMRLAGRVKVLVKAGVHYCQEL